MNTVRYVVCGAMSGYAVFAVTIGLLLGGGWDAILTALFAVIGGGYYGYRHAKKKQAAANIASTPGSSVSTGTSWAEDNLAA